MLALCSQHNEVDLTREKTGMGTSGKGLERKHDGCKMEWGLKFQL